MADPEVAKPAGETTALNKPPAYDDVYGKLKSMRDESDGNVDYLRRMVTYIFCGTRIFLGLRLMILYKTYFECTPLYLTVCVALWICVLLAIPVAMIAIGSVWLHDCPRERFIPIYLIVGGVFGLIKALANGAEQIKLRKDRSETDGEDDPKRSPVNPFDGCVNIFLLAWFIAGSYWIYHIYTDYQSEFPGQPKYCHRTLYLFAFWLQTIKYIFMAISLLLCCCGCVFMCCVGLISK